MFEDAWGMTQKWEIGKDLLEEMYLEGVVVELFLHLTYDTHN